MASRQEEKERRRQERLAQEQSAQKAAARKRTFGLIGGLLLAAAAIAAVVLVITTGGGDDDAADSGGMAAAARSAGCEFRQLGSEGRDHVEEPVKPSDFKSNPPASGKHAPVAAQDGYYQAGNEPDLGNWIHALEHGRITFQWKEGAARGDIQKLRDLAGEELQGSAGYHTLVFQNNSEMRFPFAAVGWTRYLGCQRLTPEALDVMRRFRTTYTDKAPEFIP